MGLLPTMASQAFPPTAIDGSNTSVLWLGVMGLLQGALGGLFLVRERVLPLLVQWMTPSTARLAPVVAFESLAVEDAREARAA